MMQELEKMIACLSVFVYPYDTASGVNQIPYLHHSKGVQAQPFGIGYKMDGSTSSFSF